MSVLQDLRHAARQVRRSPLLSGVAVLALALGIGMTTTMFSIIYGAVLRGLPFEESDRLIHLERNKLSEDIESMGVPIHDFNDWRAQQQVFEDLAAFYTGTVNLSGTERAERYSGGFVSASTFEMLRVRPLLGRTFLPEEEHPGSPQVVLLGYNIWRDRYGSDPNVVGQSIRANGQPGTIIGVMPEGFQFPALEDVWLPLRIDPLELERDGGIWLEVFGRLKPGVTLDQAAAHMNQIAARIALEHPETNEGVGAVLKPYIHEFIGKEPQTLLYTMLVAVFFVLLIACANVANLLLGRAIVRSRELAVRSALGASRARMLLGSLAEPLVLSAIGAVLGLGIAAVSVRMFNSAIAGSQPPFWIDIKIDLAALAFVLGASVLAALAAGVLPALQAARPDLAEVLKDESRGASSFRLGRLSKGLVVFEVALSFGLLAAAGLMIKTVVNVGTVDLGFSTEDVFTARLGLFEGEFPDSAAVLGFHEGVLQRLRALPGVQAAAISTSVPARGSGGTHFAIEGAAYERDQDYPWARMDAISPHLFETLGVRPLEGRDFGTEDRLESLPVALVNEPFANKYFPGESPIGRRVRLGTSESTEEWRTIVGVVPNLYPSGLDNENPEALYLPLMQRPPRFATILARTSRSPASLTPEVREAVAGVDADVPLYFVNSLQASIDEGNWFYRVFGTMFMIFGAIALFLAAVGLYGVMAFSVSRRTREVGIRMALGARGTDVLRLIFRQGFGQLAAGMLLGLLLGIGFGQLLTLADFLFGVDPRDPLIFGTIAVVLLATGAAAFYVPARRASGVDPMAALRYE